MNREKENQLTEEQTPRFIYSSEQSYECVMCANCCSDFWEIPVDKESSERIQGYDLSQIRASLRYYEPFKKSAVNPEQTIIKQVQGRCCFLTKQHLCGLHYFFGAEAKPRTCRQFPFIFVKTPDGVYVSASFACLSVQHNKGTPLTQQESLIRELYQEAAEVTTIPDVISLDGKITLSWESYKLLEAGLVELLSIETISLPQLLIAGNIYLDLLAEFIRQATSDSKYSQDEIVRSYLDIMRKQRFGRVIEIAQRASTSPILQRLYVGILVSFRNSISKKRSYLGTQAYLIWQYLVNLFGGGKYQIYPVEEKFRAGDFRPDKLNLEDSFFRHSILRYVKHLIFRKQGLDRMSWQKAYRYILLYFALIRWYATAFAVNMGEATVDRAGLLKSIGFVEQYYVRHHTMATFFTRFPQVESLLDNFMDKKHYAPSIVYPPFKE